MAQRELQVRQQLDPITSIAENAYGIVAQGRCDLLQESDPGRFSLAGQGPDR
jgi:hypothetical protein